MYEENARFINFPQVLGLYGMIWLLLFRSQCRWKRVMFSKMLLVDHFLAGEAGSWASHDPFT